MGLGPISGSFTKISPVTGGNINDYRTFSIDAPSFGGGANQYMIYGAIAAAGVALYLVLKKGR